MIVDFHTHRLDSPYPALVSAERFDAAPLVSRECHPWKLPEKFTPFSAEFAEQLPLFSALGEIGLDRVRGVDFAVQQQYLDALLRIAAEAHKPVVIHCVRAFPELFAALKPYDLNVMIHGFRGKVALLEELWKRKMTVSFSLRAVENDALMERLKHPCGAFGFESDDDANCDVACVMERAGKRCGRNDLEDFCFNSFAEFLDGKGF